MTTGTELLAIVIVAAGLGIGLFVVSTLVNAVIELV
jgi:hypothetical protein